MSPVMRTVVRTVTRLNIAVYRASKGRIGGANKGLRFLLLTVPGRKSGRPHTNPVGFIRHDNSWVVTGSAGGMDTEPQWFQNLRATDRATVEVGPSRTEVSVAVADSALRQELWPQLIAVAPYFADYQKKCDREIPMAVLTPV